MHRGPLGWPAGGVFLSARSTMITARDSRTVARFGSASAIGRNVSEPCSSAMTTASARRSLKRATDKAPPDAPERMASRGRYDSRRRRWDHAGLRP
jgi:hypothetical protein